MTKNLNFVMGGVNLVDVASHNPYIGLYNFNPVNSVEVNRILHVPQSRRWEFPMEFVW